MNVVQIPGLAPAVQPQQQIKARGLPCRKLSKVHRGLLVADIIEGNVILIDLSVRQLSAVVGVSTAYAHAALHMPTAERENVRRGLRPLIQPKAPAAPLTPRKRIEQIVAEIGFDATLTLLVANEPAVAAEAAA
jgi:hypothetical protein